MAAESPPTKSVSRGNRLRFAVLLTLLAAGFLLARWTPLAELFAEDGAAAFRERLQGIWWAPLVLVGLYTLMAPLAMPTGVLLPAGAAFGPLHGSLYNTAGLFLGAAASYFVARLLGRDFVVQITGPKLRRAEKAFERRGFWPLVQTRFLPLPFPVVNFGAALAGIGAPLFLTTAVVGLVPSTVLHTFFIARLYATQGQQRLWTFVAYGGAFVVFNLVIGVPWIRRWLRSRRNVKAQSR